MVNSQDILTATDSRMKKSVGALIRELNSIRTGRASPSLVENLSVEYYGIPTPLNQLATISVPESRLLCVEPWDKNTILDIEKSILKSNLGLVPNNDGVLMRIPIPQLTEERRRELVRLVGTKVEEGHVSVRNVRRDSLSEIRKIEKDKLISQDESRKSQEQLQVITDRHIATMDSLKIEKQAEVMEV